MSDGEFPLTQPVSSANCAALFVSLYLMVLAFFILLNSIAQTDQQKMEAVVQSLGSTFIKTSHGEQAIEYTLTGEGVGGVGDMYFSPFKELVNLESVDIQQHGNEMRSIMPISVFFTENSTDLRPEKKEFMDRMAHILKRNLGQYRLEVECLVGSANYLQGGNVAQDTARAGVIARALLERGIEPRAVTIGLTGKQPGYISLGFYVRSVEKSQLPLN